MNRVRTNVPLPVGPASLPGSSRSVALFIANPPSYRSRAATPPLKPSHDLSEQKAGIVAAKLHTSYRETSGSPGGESPRRCSLQASSNTLSIGRRLGPSHRSAPSGRHNPIPVRAVRASSSASPLDTDASMQLPRPPEMELLRSIRRTP